MFVLFIDFVAQANVTLEGGIVIEEMQETPEQVRYNHFLDLARACDTHALKKLLHSGTDVNAADWPIFETALMAAAEAGCTETVHALLAAGAHVNKIDTDSTTALMRAVAKGHVSIVEALLRAGADVNAINCMGSTALHAAVLQGNIAIVKALLNAGVDVTVVNYMGHTALDDAKESGSEDTVNFIENYLSK